MSLPYNAIQKHSGLRLMWGCMGLEKKKKKHCIMKKYEWHLKKYSTITFFKQEFYKVCRVEMTIWILFKIKRLFLVTDIVPH